LDGFSKDRQEDWREKVNGNKMAFISLDNAIVPVMIPQTAPMTVTEWDSNWVIGGLLGAGLLLGWIATGWKKKRTSTKRK
jgi:hypothetical protein